MPNDKLNPSTVNKLLARTQMKAEQLENQKEILDFNTFVSGALIETNNQLNWVNENVITLTDRISLGFDSLTDIFKKQIDEDNRREREEVAKPKESMESDIQTVG